MAKNSNRALPYSGITLAAGTGAADLSMGSSAPGRFELLSAEGTGTGVAAARSPAAASLFTASSSASDAVFASLPVGDSTAIVQCAISDSAGGAFMAFNPANGGASVVHYVPSGAGYSQRTIPSASLPQPSVCLRLGPTSSQPLRFLVGTRSPGLFVVSASAAGVEAQSVALSGASSKPIVLGSRAALSRATSGVFLQSDDATSAGGSGCNTGDGDVVLHVVDGSGTLTSIPSKLKGVCPRSMAVSPDSSSAIVISTEGRLFRASLRSLDRTSFSEFRQNGRSALSSGESIVSVVFLQSPKLTSPSGAAAVIPFNLIRPITSEDGTTFVTGKLRAVVDSVPVGQPKRGSVEMLVATVDASRIAAPYDAVLEASMTWNIKGATKNEKSVETVPLQGLHLVFARAPTLNRWLLANATVRDASGEGVSWLPSSAQVSSSSFVASANVGDEIACGRLWVPLSSGSPALDRGWLELQDFRMAAFSDSDGSARSYGCGASETCELKASATDGTLAASCTAAEPTTVVIRADLGTASIATILEQASKAAGAPVTVVQSTSRRRIHQTASGGDTLTLSTGSGPTGGAAAIQLVNAVNSGSSTVSSLQGISVAGSEEISNPAVPAITTTPSQFDHACVFGTAIFFVRADAAASELSVTSFDPTTGTWTSAFGGLSAGAPTSALRAYIFADGTWETIAPPSGVAPPARSSATFVSLSDTSLLLTAGLGSASAPLTDVWLFDVVASEWAQLQTPSSSASFIRYGSSAAALDGVVYIFGGASQPGSGATFYNALYSFAVAPSSTSLPSPTLVSDGLSQLAPSPRVYALMQLQNMGSTSRIFVTGGYESGGQAASLADLYIFDIGARVWAKVSPIGTGPPDISGAAASYGNALYMHSPTAGGLFAWSPAGVTTFASASKMMGGTSVLATPQVTYPVSSTVILLGGTVSASWVSATTKYDSATVTLFPVDRSRVFPVFTGANTGACRLSIPSTVSKGSYRIQVVLTGPTVPVPLSITSNAFSVIQPESALEAVAEEVFILTPATSVDVLLGDELNLAWTTRGLPSQQNVNLSLVATTTTAAVEFSTVASLAVGLPFALRWSSTGIESTSMVQISLTNVATATRVPIAVRRNSGSFAFVPSAAMGTGLFFFELSTSLRGRTISASSSNFILEVPPAFILLRLPDGRTPFATGQTVPIRWDSGNLDSRSVALRLVGSDDTIIEIADSVANTGIYTYIISTEVKSGQYSVEVGVGDWKLSSRGKPFTINAEMPSISISPIPSLLPGQFYTIKWTTTSLPLDAVVKINIVSVESTNEAAVQTLAPEIGAQVQDWIVDQRVAPGKYRIDVAVKGVLGSSAVFSVLSPPPTRDPCLGKPPTSRGFVIGANELDGEATVLEIGRSDLKLSAEGSVACDGTPAASVAWLEVGSPDPKRRAHIAAPSALTTAVTKLRVGMTTFELVVRDRLNQESRSTVVVKVINRKIVSMVVCLDDGFSSLEKRLNNSAIRQPLATSLGGFLKQTLNPNSFAQLQISLCPEGGGAALSFQVPAVVGRTGTEIAEELSRMIPSDFPNGALSFPVAGARRSLFGAASTSTVPIAVTRLFVKATPSQLNAAPSTPALALFPASRYSYVVVDTKTKLGAVEVVAAAEDVAPGVVAAWEWYVNGKLQDSTEGRISLNLAVGVYSVQAVVFDDENLDSESELLVLHVVDEYSCNDLVLVLDAASSEASQVYVRDFVMKLLRPFWIQGPDSYVSIVRYSLLPAGNATVVLHKAEVKAAYEAVEARRLPNNGTDPTAPRLMARGMEAAQAAALSIARRGVVRSVVLLAFDQPLDDKEALNASAPIKQRSNLYAVPMIADTYAFESGLDLFRTIVTQARPNTTNVQPVTMDLPDELHKAAIELAKTICEGKAPPGADEEEVTGKTIGQAITAAVAAAVGASVAGAIGSSVGASMSGGAGISSSGGVSIISQAQFISETSFLNANIGGAYNATASSTQWTMLFLGAPWRSGSDNSSSVAPRVGRRLLGANAFTRQVGSEVASPLLQESIFWSALGLGAVTIVQIIAALVFKHVFRFKETPKIFWFPKPQVAVVFIAYEGFVLAAAATSRLTDTFWRTVGALLLVRSP
eukprot:tig00000114_g6021.t1